jgi:hypothetical protein
MVRYEPLHETAFVPEYVNPVELPDIVGVIANVDLSLHTLIVFVAVRVIEYASLPSSHTRRPTFTFRLVDVVTDTGDDTAEPAAFTAVTTTVYSVTGDKPENIADLEVTPLFVVGVVATPLRV